MPGEGQDPAAPQGGEAGGGQSSPDPVELSGDTLITHEGLDEPVAWSEYQQRYVPKDELTRMRQQDSQKVKEQLKAYRDQLDKRYQQAYQQAVQRFQGGGGGGQGGAGQGAPPGQRGGGGGLDRVEEILAKSKEYSGYVTADQLRELHELYSGEIGRRDQALGQYANLLKMLAGSTKNLQGPLSEIMDERAERQLGNKVSAVMQKLGIPDKFREGFEEIMKDVYYSHEGDDLDDVFEDLATKRWEQIQQVVKGADKHALEANKPSTRTPGKGGEAAPSMELPDFDPEMTEREFASKVFDELQGAPAT